MAKEKIWFAIYDAERGTGEASWMVRALKRKGIHAETGHSPYVGKVAVHVHVVPTVKNLHRLKTVIKNETGNRIDVGLIRSNIRRGLET
jgi:hypothetical protein